MSELNRYQNPDVFEKLAMSYAAGTLHGRARTRFEALMEQHFYLQATVSAYESKFGNLVELLPSEKPSDRVWQGIEASILRSLPAEEAPKAGPRSWFGWLKQGYAYAALAVVIAILVIVNPLSTGRDAIAYAAVLESADNTPMAITRITQDDLTLSVDLVKDIPLEDGDVLKLWCRSKKGGKPVFMGELSKGSSTRIQINQEEWDHLKLVGSLEITSESTVKANGPHNAILKGSLTTITEK